jgi:hypothetical protein
MKTNINGLTCHIHPDTCPWVTNPPLINNIVLKGTNCRLCANSRASVRQLKDFVSDAIKAHPPTKETLAVNPMANSRFDYSKTDYEGHKKKITVRCIEHEHEYECTPPEHLSSKHGCCDVCMRKATSGENHHGFVSRDEIKRRISIYHGGVGEWKTYTNERGTFEYQDHGSFHYQFRESRLLSDRITIYCPRPHCDRYWESLIGNHIHPIEPRGCSTCSGSKGEKAWLDMIRGRHPNLKLQYKVLLDDLAHQKLLDRRSLYLDGFDPDSNTAFEFLGCWYHGCPNKDTCRPVHPPFDDNKIHVEIKKTMLELREAWFARKSVLEALGYKVVSIWECEWKRSRITNGDDASSAPSSSDGSCDDHPPRRDPPH